MAKPGTNVLAHDLLKGAVAGAVGVWAMDRVDWFLYDRESHKTRDQTIANRPGGEDPAHVMAGTAAETLGVPLTGAKRDRVGTAVHYGLGIIPGALYGALSNRFEAIGAGRGLAYGLAMFLIEDELANTALGTAGPPSGYPWQAHARGLVAHLVLGCVTDAAFRMQSNAVVISPAPLRAADPLPPSQTSSIAEKRAGN